jgi:thioester reductase-like protein
MDNSGNVLVEACGLMLQRLKSNSPNDPEELDRYLYHVEWQPQGLPDPTVVTQADSGRWLIVTDRTGLGDAVAYGLRAQGSECTVVRTTGTSHERFSFGNAASVRQRIAHFLQQGKPPRGVVYLAALDTKVVSEDHEPSAQPELFGLLHLVQTLVEQEWITPPRLWIVTRGAQMVLKSDLIELNQTPIWGLARTIANEHPQLRCSNIDLAAAPHVDDAVGVHAEILADQQEDRVVYRKGERRVARLVRYDPIPIGLQRPARPGEAYRLETAKPGMLDNLIWRAVDREPPEPDQVEIQVHSAGLNFLDVLTALGLHPDQTHGDSILGMECAGVVSRVGCHVVGIRVGDRVVAIAPHSFGAYTRTLSNMVAVLPENLNCHDASTVPIAYLTAYYALCTLGRLQRGERILIHAAAGGVGLAAVHLAQRIGAEIFATAGNAEKREFLHNLGIEHVMDSRSLHFAAEVWTKTNEEGVDVVLNSLAGEVIPKSLSLLRANGRFLEIGKRDIYGRTQLDMGLLKRNIAFFAVDLIPLLAQQPRLCGELLRDVVDRLSKSDLPPLPYTQFSRSEIKKAFHFMAKARHIGKVIIGLDERTDDAVVQIAPQSMTSLRSNATYLITGGLGGLGLSVAAQIVDRGARHLVLLGRNGPSAEALEMLTSLQMRGAEVITVQADVTKEADVCSVLRQIQASLPPLRGIFHAAGVLDDGLLVQMNRDDLERVMAPKVQGTWLLHKYTQTLDLDLFVLFSSIASIVGSPGQGNYVAANSFLDGLAHYRQQQGLPALAINWGPWGEVGMAAGASVTQFLLQQGIRAFPPRLGIELLERILDTSAVQITAFDVDWPQMLQRFPSPFLQKMVEETEAGTNLGSAKTSTVLRNRLLALAPIKRRQAVMNQLLNQVSQVTRMPLEQIDIYLPLSQQGIDSLMATELATRIKTDLDVSLPLPTLLQGPTVVNLAETVMKLLGPSTSSENVPGTTVTSIVDGEASDDHFALSIVALRNEAFLDPMIQFASAVTEKRSTGGHLFLTGPTGFLGTFLLRDLLLNTDFQIYCLVRAADPITGRERVLRSLKHFFPDEALHLDRVTAVLGDLQAPDLGLSQSEFDWFSEQMDLIIHCGAAVNWLAPYEHLKPTNVLGTQAVIRLAAQRRLTPLHYISSLAIFPLVGNDRLTMIDENTSLDHGGILYGGYTQSKWVAEKLIAVAQDRGLPISIYRPSLIVGHSEKGTWQDDGIIARMLRSWINLGFAPDLDARLDLVPVNYVSRAIVHLSLDDHERKTTTYHLCSSRAVTVQNLIDWLNGCGYSVRKIPYDQWRHLILNRENLSQQTLLSSVGPLLALQTSENVDWIRYIPNFGDRQTREVLNGLNCSLVDASTFQLYSSYFRRTGFFPAAPNG